MKTSAELKTGVMDELMFEPSIDEAGIGVAVNDGVVTLTGHVKNFTEKMAADRAAGHDADHHGPAHRLRGAPVEGHRGG